MDAALILGAGLLGLAGAPHCAAMCGAPCAAVIGGGPQAGSRAAAFHGGRLVAYATAGAVLAAGVNWLSLAGSATPVLRPLWTLLHIGALALGLWLLATGRQPAVLARHDRTRPSGTALAGGHGWQVMRTPWTAAAAGSAWVAWPCGLLQSALVVATLANTPQAGAAAMAAFALTSAAGLQATPWLAARLSSRGGAVATWAVRGAGLLLAAGAAWALGHDLWGRVLAYCTT